MFFALSNCFPINCVERTASIEHAIAYCVMLFTAVVMHGDDGVREFRREQDDVITTYQQRTNTISK